MDEATEESRFYGVAVAQGQPLTLPNGHHLCVFYASLIGGGQHAVNVWAEAAGGETRPIVTLSPEKAEVAVPHVILRGQLVLRHDSADAAVSLYCHILFDGEEDDDTAADAPARLVERTVIAGVEFEPLDDDDYPEAEISDRDDEGDMVHLHAVDLWPPSRVGDDGDGLYQPVVEYDLASEEDEAERYDSDNGEEDEDGGGEEIEPPGKVRDDGDSLGQARYAAVENTAGFMCVASAEAAGGQDEGKEIIFLYRYTRFSRTWSGRRGVEVCRRTKLHRLRFAVPPAGDMASSLAWAGSSLGPLIYPALFRQQLCELWSSLSAPAMSTIPPRTARLQVIVDVGILRPADHTQERMDHMRGALEAKMQEAWPEHYHVGMKLRLPEPVLDDEEQGDDTRAAKRRKMADDGEEESENDECAVCFDPLESGLAAWPGCRHVFHGACVEKTLAGSEMCPLCRTKLSD